jgi:hypothetical protein
MESQNNFSKGLHTDSHEQFQPQGTYRFAENYIRDISGALRNEPGTLARTAVPTGLEIIGSTVLGTKVILFLCSLDSTQNEIGVFDSTTNSYSTVINDPVLNFKITNQVDAISRINFQHESIAYYVDNINPPRKINIDAPPTAATYSAATKLIRDLTNTTIALDGVYDIGGNLKCGTYQFGIRYVDANGNKTAFGQWSKEVPVTPYPKSIGRQQFQGGDLGTIALKTIILDLGNLDPLFPFIEVGVSYFNASAQQVFKIADKIPVNNTTMIYTFSALPPDDAETIDFNEAVVQFPNITTAKCIEQKDNRCFISNVNEATEADLQEIANNISVEYEITEVDHYDDNGADPATRYLDYKLENNTFSMRGYQRDEVYSLAFGVLYKNGTQSFGYHIPARLGTGNNNISGTGGTLNVGDLRDPSTPDRVWVAPTVVTATSGLLGTYVSIKEYPVHQNYPTDGIFQAGTPNLYLIRHHKMPSLEQQPHFGPSSTGLGASNAIRILGLKFTLNSTARALLDALGDQVQGIVFYREPRDLPEKTSVFSQGVTKHLFQTYNSYDTDHGNKQGTAVFKKEPWFGNYNIQQLDFSILLSTRRTLGFYPTSDASLSSVPWDSYDTTGKVERNKVAFYSPEVYLDVYKMASFSPTITGTEKMNLYGNKLKPALKINGTPGTVIWNKADRDHNLTNAWMDHEPQVWLFNNYNTSANLSGSEGDSHYLDPNKPQIVPGGNGGVDIGESGILYDNSASADFLYLKTLTDIDKPHSGQVVWTITVDSPGSVTGSSIIETLDTQTETKVLFNMVSDNPSQYGDIGNKPFNVISTILSDDPSYTGTVFHCYGGDTFICRWSFHDQDKFQCVGYTYNISTATNWAPFVSVHSPDDTTTGLHGLSFKSMSYLYVESRVNPDYQHTDSSNQYYPQTDPAPLFQTKPYTKTNNTQYNKTYSHDVTIQNAFSKAADFIGVGRFETRTYYSPVSIQGEKLDAFSEFKANDYDDLPKHTGEIIDSFVWENELYMHTPMALWQTFVNPRAAQVDTYGDVYTGTGSIFAIPGRQIFTINGGYAGTTSQWAGCNTPFGRFFIDNRQGKVFLFNSEGLEEISNHGMFNEFLQRVVDAPDNPASGLGYFSAYDYKRKRWILSQGGNGATAGYSISYHPELKTWTSYHTYLPTHEFTVGNRMFMFRSGTYNIHEMGLGSHGSYFGDTAVDSILTFVTNEASGQLLSGQPVNAGIGETKVFDNMEFHTLSYNTSGVTQLFNTFTKIQHTNEYQDSGLYQIITSNVNYIDETFSAFQLLCRMKKDHFQIAIPRDNTGDDRRLKSKWLTTTVNYDNSADNALILNFIRTRSRLLFR